MQRLEVLDGQPGRLGGDGETAVGPQALEKDDAAANAARRAQAWGTTVEESLPGYASS